MSSERALQSQLPHILRKEDGLRSVDYKSFAPTADSAVAQILEMNLIGVGKCGLAFDYFAEFEEGEEEARLVARLDCLNPLGRDATFELLEKLKKKYLQFEEDINYLLHKFSHYYDEKYSSKRSQKQIRLAFESRIAGHNAFFRSYSQHTVPINTVLTIGEGENAVPLLTLTKKVVGTQLTDEDSPNNIPTELLYAISMGDPKLHNIFIEMIADKQRFTVIDIAKFVSSVDLLPK